MASNPKAMDVDDFLERVGNDRALATDLGRLYLASIDAMVQSLDAAVHARRPEAIAHHAHAIKGMVANFSALEATNLANALEQLGRSGNLDDCEPTREALAVVLGQLSKEIELWCRTDPA